VRLLAYLPSSSAKLELQRRFNNIVAAQGMSSQSSWTVLVGKKSIGVSTAGFSSRKPRNISGFRANRPKFFERLFGEKRTIKEEWR
jgi:hypothetical protein